jgi:hypothetical protein
MSDDANISMGFSENLLPEEEKVYKKYDAEISKILLENNLTGRYFWVGKEEVDGRIISLFVNPSSKPIIKVPSSQFISISSDVKIGSATVFLT